VRHPPVHVNLPEKVDRNEYVVYDDPLSARYFPVSQFCIVKPPSPVGSRNHAVAQEHEYASSMLVPDDESFRYIDAPLRHHVPDVGSDEPPPPLPEHPEDSDVSMSHLLSSPTHEVLDSRSALYGK